MTAFPAVTDLGPVSLSLGRDAACAVPATANAATAAAMSTRHISVVLLIILAFFLFRENADDWFQARGFMLKREVRPSERR